MRKKIIVSILIVLSSVILFFIFGIFFFNNKKNFYSLPEIEFPQALGEEYSFSVVNSISDEKTKEINNKKEIVAYDTQKSNIDINILCKKLNIENKIKANNRDNTEYGDDIKKLIIQNDGKIVFQDMKLSNEELNLKDSECIDIAEEFMDSIDLNSEELDVYGIVDITCNDIDKPESKMIIEKQVIFNRQINGIDVYGDSKVIVAIKSDGSIGKFMANYNNLSTKIPIDKFNSVTTGIEKIKKYEGYIDVPENTNQIELKNVEIKYWESEDDSKSYVIQPVYEYTGKAYDGEEYLGTVKIIEPMAY